MIAMAAVVMAVTSVIFMPMISVVMSLIFMSLILVSMVFVAMVFMRDVVSVVFVAMVFRSGMLLMAHFPAFLSGMFLMAHFPTLLIPFMGAVRDFVSMVFMLPVIMMIRVAADGIRMNIFVAVHPCALPRRVIDEDHATVPGNAVIAPAPWPE